MKHLDGIDINPAWVGGINWSAYNIDSESGLILARQLEHVQNKAYEQKLPNLMAREVFGVNYSFDSGAESTTYTAYTGRGEFELIGDYRKDFHNIGLEGENKTNNFYSFGRLISYSVQDIRAAQMAGIPLNAIQIMTARRMWEQKLESISLVGEANSNLTGLLNTPGITKTTAANAFSGASALQMYDAISAEIVAMVDGSKGEETPGVVYVPYGLTGTLNKQVSNNYRMSVKDAIMQDYSVAIKPWAALSGALGGKDVIVVKSSSTDTGELAISQEFELGAPQPENMAFSMTAHARTAGLMVYYPAGLRVLRDK